MSKLFAGLMLLLMVQHVNADTAYPRIEFQEVGKLSAPSSNNAVALLASPGDGHQLLSLLGLGEEKTWQSIHYRAEGLSLDNSRQSTSLPSLPLTQGRLAASAVSLGESVYLFGGYTVAEDHSEISTPEVFKISKTQYARQPDMPVPVDDAVVMTYRDRYIYLVSGWHDVGNVNLVQVFDSQTQSWTQATQFPGAAVFGHAGGMAGNEMVICDGVKIEYPADGSSRRFLPSNECWLGIINEDDHRRIQWLPLPPHPGPSRYRMAASTEAPFNKENRVIFAGGSTNPYNYDGIGYNGIPSEPEDLVFGFDFEHRQWRCYGRAGVATMDHRGLVAHGDTYFIIGGMLRGQTVSDRVYRFRLAEPMEDCQ